MVSRKFFGLLALAGLATSALLFGCGGSSSSDTVTTIPTSATVFYVHSVAFKNSTSQTLYAWGYNGFGQLGTGNLENQTAAVPVATPVPVDRVAAGGNHTLAFASAFANVSSVYAWGSNSHGQIGQPTTTGASAFSSTPVRISLDGKVTNIAAGGFHSLAVVGGEVRSWGYNGFGQLGDDSLTDKTVPTPVLSTGNGNITGISDVAAGATHSLALTSDGRVYAWGNNALGQLGTDPALPLSFRSTADLVQVAVTVLTDVTQIAAGVSTSYALKSDGTVWAWGYNGMGQLGLPANAEANYQPVQIPFGQLGAVTVVRISAGWDHVLALLSDGTIAAWGFNFYGQLGNNDTSNTRVSTPARVLTGGSGVPGSGSPMDEVTDIIAFGNHSLARSNGVWYGWGNNGNGQLGRPISTSGEGFFRVPAPVLGL